MDAAAGFSRPWVAFFKDQRVWAYADRLSLRPGERFNVMASSGPAQPPRRVRLEVFRLGAAESTAPVWISAFQDVQYHGATASAAAIGPGWPAAFADIDTASWRPGVYSADIVEQTTATRDVRAFQLILTNPRRSGAVLCRLGTNTWQAYNPWGGHSLYPNGDDENRGVIVTFDRPTAPSLFEYDIHLVRWLESLAADFGGIDFATNFDVHADPDLLHSYRLLITGGHDEYWSKEEFDAVEKRIFHAGGNVCFFGGNTAYCQIRYSDINAAPGSRLLGRQLICYKTAADPILSRASAVERTLLRTSNFRVGARRPETMLLGGAYQGWFDPASAQRPPFLVADDKGPFFRGTGWKVGDTAADVVGYEWDNRDPEGDGRRLWDEKQSLIAPIDPASVRVLMRGRPIDAQGRPGLAEATWYRSRAGAKVFNAGTVRWAWGLSKEGFARPGFRRFNENLVRDMLI
ncbi:MAG: N,N-dimethylformamidase beta subunit family domain-containing protein [Caulobacteraceae bacterium]